MKNFKENDLNDYKIRVFRNKNKYITNKMDNIHKEFNEKRKREKKNRYKPKR